MNDIKFDCPQCGQSLAVDATGAGTSVACPQCGQTILVPQLARRAQPKRTRGWWLAVPVVLVLSLLVAGVLLWQRHGQSSVVSDAGNEPAVPKQIVQPAVNDTHGTITVDVKATTDTDAQGALTVVTNFEGGSASVLALDARTQMVRITPGGKVDRGWPCWWYLQLKGVDVHRPLVLQVIANTSVGSSEEGTQHKKLGADWSLPNQAAISTNGVDWEQTLSGERQGNKITYRIQPEATNLWLAWGPPFTLTNAWSFVQAAAHDHPFAKYFTLATSRENRQVPALQVSEGDLPASNRPAIWVLGRQHAWEVGGTWVVAGFAEWLLSNDPRATRLRSEAEIFVVPVMDGDHVATGDGGKDSIPRDPNRDWSDTAYYREVAAVQKSVLAQVKENRMALFVDVHDPGAKARDSQLWVTPTKFLGALGAQNQERFIRAAIKEVQPPMPVTDHLVWDGPAATEYWQTEWHHLSCPWVYEHGNAQTVAVTLEVPWNAPDSTIDGYHSVGEGLGRTIELYMSETQSSKTLAGASGATP